MKNHLHTTPNEHLEARITAWVLGQASPFEAAELEALCAADPELQLFLNRTKALHSLLLETPPSTSDQFWKLSPENRTKLDPIIGSNSSTPSHKHSGIRRAAYRTAFGIAAVLTITVFIKRFIFAPLSMNKEASSIVAYESTLNPQASDEEVFFEETSKEEKSNRITSTLSKKPSTPSFSAPAPAEERDNTLALADRNLENGLDGEGLREYRQSAGEAPRSRMASQEFDATKAQSAIIAGNRSVIPVPSVELPKPSLGLSEGEDSAGIGYASGGGGGDMSNHAMALRAAAISNSITLNDSLENDGFTYDPNKGKKELLKSDVTLSSDEKLAEAFKGLEDESRLESSEINSVVGSLRSDLAFKDETPDAALKIPKRNAPGEMTLVPTSEGGPPTDGFAFGDRSSSVVNSTDAKTENDDPFADNNPTDDPFATPAQTGKGTSTASGGVIDPFAKASTSTSNLPITPANPLAFESGIQAELDAFGDIPITGRLFQEGKDGGIESEISAGYKSEYLFRGLSLAEEHKPSLIDLSEELSTTEEVFSTFSLNISDASFQIASAAVAKGERPDPTSIKPEQFYNAVDYGDPAPSASEPVAAAIDQTAHPVIPGRNLVRVALRTGSTGRSAAQPLRLTLLVDQSGSMVRADRRAAMETALASLATLLTENDRITVIGFSRIPHLLAQSLPGNEAGKLPDLINQTASEGGTNLEQAINLATEQAISHQLAGAQNRIVLFTDGAANLGDADPERLSKKIQDLRQQGLAFDIAGIGTNDLNDRLLSDLARHGNGRYYLVGEKTGGNLATQLAGAFRPAAENVKVQVKLNPQRVGNYKLIGFEKDRLKTEDFRNDAVDAAELAADEAGVALYQVETLPEGTGEIGEVSVRFRDTATGEMVERTWTIPYDASAPSFDKANPKTQLATLALLAAQKLQTGPMADAIDFSNYSETIAKLKQAHTKSAKTQQLLNLINGIK
ncbi:MAG: von Willebrand factor type A domain-containing protein [Verrucomicrobiota bacterium]